MGWPRSSRVIPHPLLCGILVLGTMACHRSPLPRICVETELGDMEVEIYQERAPLTAGNFLALVDQGIYKGAVFYRVVRMDNQPENPVKIEVIQGGLFDEERIVTFPVVAHETTEQTGILHLDGVISMARNEPGSASTEFFICIGDQPDLDYGGQRNPDGQGFAAFGRVIRGMEVVRAIQIRADQDQYLRQKVGIRRIYRIPD